MIYRSSSATNIPARIESMIRVGIVDQMLVNNIQQNMHGQDHSFVVGDKIDVDHFAVATIHTCMHTFIRIHTHTHTQTVTRPLRSMIFQNQPHNKGYLTNCISATRLG